MTGGQFLRKGGKGCLRRLLERRSILDFCVSTEASVISKQQSRAYGRSPILSRKFRESGISPPIYSSSLSSSCASSSRNGLVGWYLGLIESRPVLTKSITSALIYTAADLTSQKMSQASSEPFDLIRTLRMAGYGMLVLGPSLHFWFNFVSKVLPKRDMITTLKKIFLGQAVYGPVMTTIFFSQNAAVQANQTSLTKRYSPYGA